jgi:hypothetical protein
MASLIERIHAAREQWVDAGGSRWLIRRPTLYEFTRLRQDTADLLRATVVGWELRELDLVPGGTDQVAAFDPQAALEYLEDRPEAYTAVLDAIYTAVSAFMQAKDAAAGKS